MKRKTMISILAAATMLGNTMVMPVAMAETAGAAASENAAVEAALSADELYEKANEARQAGDQETANMYQEMAAEAGNATAAGKLSEAYHNGNFGVVDYDKAFHFAEIAYQGGDSKGTMYYGVMLLYGRGTEQNPDAALEAIQFAYDSGEIKAARYLGYAYLDGIGVEQDDAMAAEWFAKGVDNGDLTSMIELGKLYLYGKGVDQDYDRAMELFLNTVDGRADHVTAGAMVQLGVIYENGYGVDANEDTAIEWYLKALSSGLEGDEVEVVEASLKNLGVSEETIAQAKEAASEDSGNNNGAQRGSGNGGFGGGQGGPGNGGFGGGQGGHGNGGFGGGQGGPGNGGFGGGQAQESDPAISVVLEENAAKFEQLTYEDAETGKTLEYSLYVPENYSEAEQYPMIMFIPDATGAGLSAADIVQRYYGAAVWATEEDQEKHPCFILTPAFTETVVDDDWNTSDEIEIAVRLIASLQETYSIDGNRLYTTGQSMGCMTSLYLNSVHPDLFAASLFVSGQWDITVLKELETKSFFYITAGGDVKASGGQDEVMAMFDADGVSYSYGTWNAQDDVETQNAATQTLIEQGNAANMIRFEEGSVLNGGSGMEHMASFNYGYKIPAVRDWLFEQTK